MSLQDQAAPPRGSANLTIASNAVWSLLRYAVNWLALLVLPPLIINDLGRDVYATWTIILQIAAYYSAFEVHFQTAVARFVARAAAEGGEQSLNATTASIMLLLAIVGVALVVPGVALTVSIRGIFPAIPGELADSASAAATIVIVGLALSLPFTTMLGTFLGLQRNANVTIATVLARIASVTLMVTAVKLGGGMISLAWCFTLGIYIPIAYYMVSWRTLPLVRRVDLRLARSSIVSDFAAFSSSAVLLGACSVLLLGLSIPIVTVYDFDGVSAYALAAVFAGLLVVPQSAILWVVLPRMAERSIANDPVLMGRLLLKLVRLSGVALTFITAGLLAAAPAFLPLWVGADLASEVLPLAVLLTLGQFVGLTMHPYRVAITGTGQQMRSIPSILLEGGTNVVLALMLVRQFGALGVAIASIGGSVAAVIFHTSISMPLTDTVRPRRLEYLRAGVMFPLIAIVPALLIFWWESAHPPSLGIAAIAVVAACGGAIVPMWFMVVDRSDRDDLVAIARSAHRRVRRA